VLCSLLGSYLGILDLAQGSRLIRKWPLRAMLSANFPGRKGRRQWYDSLSPPTPRSGARRGEKSL